jgi:hypothetical protein
LKHTITAICTVTAHPFDRAETDPTAKHPREGVGWLLAKHAVLDALPYRMREKAPPCRCRATAYREPRQAEQSLLVPDHIIHPAFGRNEPISACPTGELPKETTMRHLPLIIAAGSLAAFAAPAQAAHPPVASAPAPAIAGFDHSPHPFGDLVAHHQDWRDDRYDHRWRDRNWDDSHRWDGRRLRSRDRVWRGRDGRSYCRRDDGTTGLLIGAGVGALLGREIDRHGDRTLGTVLGAIGGGLLGREIDRDVRCR